MREESVCWFVRSSPEEGGNEEGTCDKKTRSRLGGYGVEAAGPEEASAFGAPVLNLLYTELN